MKEIIAARLTQHDQDIKEAIQDINQGELSKLIRQGLRLVLQNIKQKEQNKNPQTKKLDWRHLK